MRLRHILTTWVLFNFTSTFSQSENSKFKLSPTTATVVPSPSSILHGDCIDILPDLFDASVPADCWRGTRDLSPNGSKASGGIRLEIRDRTHPAFTQSSNVLQPRQQDQSLCYAVILLAALIQAENAGQATAQLVARAQHKEDRLVARLIVLGFTLSQSGQHARAMVPLAMALRLDASNQDALEFLGVSLQHTGRSSCAYAFHREAIARDPRRPVPTLNLGLLGLFSGDSEGVTAAVVWLEAAADMCAGDMAQLPLAVSAMQALGSAHAVLGRPAAAVRCFRACARLDPRAVECRMSAAAVYTEESRLEPAVGMLSQALAALRPLDLGRTADRTCVVELCLLYATVAAWGPYGRLLPHALEVLRRAAVGIDDGEPPAKTASAVLFLGVPDDLQLPLMRALSRSAARHVVALPYSLPAAAAVRGAGGVHVGYLSSDFGQTVMLSFLARALTLHTRRRGVKVTCLSLGGAAHGGSRWRREVEEGVEVFAELGTKEDAVVAEDINKRAVGVLIYLDGHNSGARLAVMALRPAPVQVAYRFCTGLGAHYIPWYIGDRIMGPPDLSRSYFDERLVYLPPSYLPNSLAYRFPAPPDPLAADRVRRAHGIAGSGAVLACFNRALKITAKLMATWTTILQHVSSATLWLVAFPPEAAARLLAAAEAAGVGGRVVVSRMAGEEGLLGMMAAADAFLDTPDCHAHTTASYALWAGRPVITLALTKPVARVGASLLIAHSPTPTTPPPPNPTHTTPRPAARAEGSETYLCRNMEEYLAVAIAVARRGRRAVEGSGGWVGERRLFDSQRWTSHVEVALKALWDTYLAPPPLHTPPHQPDAKGRGGSDGVGQGAGGGVKHLVVWDSYGSGLQPP